MTFLLCAHTRNAVSMSIWVCTRPHYFYCPSTDFTTCLSVGNKQSMCPLMWGGGTREKWGAHQKFFDRRLQIASDATDLGWSAECLASSCAVLGRCTALRRRRPGLIALLRKCHWLAIDAASSVAQWPPRLNRQLRFLLKLAANTKPLRHDNM